MRIKKVLKSKLHSKNGMTIGELLVAVLILLLATGLLVGGVSFAARNFEKSFSKSQANVLQSTLKEAINGELRYTTTIYVNNPSKTANLLIFSITLPHT